MMVSSDYLQETKRRIRWRRWAGAFSIGGIVLVLGFYFGYQLRDWIMLPTVRVDQPGDGATVRGPEVVVEGETTPGVRLTVNGAPAYNEENGRFHTELLLPAGLHMIRVVAENRFGRTRSLDRQVVVEGDSAATSTEGGIYQ